MEYSITPIAGWQEQGKRPTAILVFDGQHIREQMVSIDTNATNIIAFSILLATALGLMVRRRSIQRQEAIDENLKTLDLLQTRDQILAAAIRAADRFIISNDLTTTIRQWVIETNQAIEAQAAYIVRTPWQTGPDFEILPQTAVGTWPESTLPIDLNFFNTPDGFFYRDQLRSAQALLIQSDKFPHRPWLDRFGIHSLAIFPIFIQKKCAAFLIFEDRRKSLNWEVGVVDTLKLTANLLGAALTRRENELHLRRSSKMEALGRMAGSVAHEFNNLLHIITGNLHTLGTKLGTAPDLKVLTDQIRQAAQRGSKIIDQLLHATRQSPIELKRSSLNQLVEHTLALAQPAFSKTIQIKSTLDPQLPELLLDEASLQQVILNLLLNARDALNHQGRIHVTTGLDLDRNRIYFQIRDEGSGISPTILDKIFEPFFTTKPPGSGTGLGLWTCKSILEQHGGGIDVNNHPDGGAAFTCYLPLHFDSKQEPTSSPESQSVSFKDQSVLLADDEHGCLQMLVDWLTEEGMKVQATSEGQELLALIQQNPAAWDWVITDWTMPGLPKEELVQQLKQLVPNAKIIVTSGFILQPAEELKVHAVLKKPFTSDELMAAMKTCLNS